MAGVTFDTAPATGTLERLGLGLANRRKLHEILVIEAQKAIFRDWPTAPSLTPLTLRARRNGGSAVMINTGMLRQRVTGQAPGSSISTVEGTLNKAEDTLSTIGTSAIYAAIHNFGGTILPRRAKALAVPCTPEASRAGSPRNMKGLNFVPSKTPNCIGMLVAYTQKRKRGQKPVFTVHYLLMRKVDIPQRKFMPTAQEFTPVAVLITEKYVQMLTRRSA